jgi:hypothetical protein
MRNLSIVVMSQIKLIPTPSRLVYFVLKAQPFFINFGKLRSTMSTLGKFYVIFGSKILNVCSVGFGD